MVYQPEPPEILEESFEFRWRCPNCERFVYANTLAELVVRRASHVEYWHGGPTREELSAASVPTEASRRRIPDAGQEPI